MRTLAEHLLDPNLPLATVDAGFPPLHIQHENRAVNVAAAVYYVEDGAAVAIINALVRPAQFSAIEAEVAELNTNTERGWARLAIESAQNLDNEADELMRQVEALRTQSKALNWAFIDLI